MDRKLILGMVQDWGIALVIVVGVLVVWGALNPSSPRSGPAPDFVVSDMAGQPAQLADLKGDVVVLNFWATWCGPCRAEIPELSAFSEAHRDVVVAGISTDDAMSVKRLAVMAGKYGVTYPIYLDDQHVAAGAYGVSGIPVTFVLDKDRQIVRVIQGSTTKEVLEAAVELARK